jgi:hypothetical protein
VHPNVGIPSIQDHRHISFSLGCGSLSSRDFVLHLLATPDIRPK